MFTNWRPSDSFFHLKINAQLSPCKDITGLELSRFFLLCRFGVHQPSTVFKVRQTKTMTVGSRDNQGCAVQNTSDDPYGLQVVLEHGTNLKPRDAAT